MIEGTVDSVLKPRIEVEFIGLNGNKIFLTLVDSGFNAEFSLPEAEAKNLGLRDTNTLMKINTASGSAFFKTYEGQILWRGLPRDIRVLGMGNQAMIGMSLLAGYVLKMEVWIDGRVAILPAGEA